MENKVKINHIKKDEDLDVQTSITTNKTEQTNHLPKKYKKQLSNIMLINFVIAIFFASIIVFLTIDPMHWYTEDYKIYLENRKDKISKKFKGFVIADDFILSKSNSKVKNLVAEIKSNPYFNQAFKSIDEVLNPDTKFSVFRSNNKAELGQEDDLVNRAFYHVKFNFIDHYLNVEIIITVHVKVGSI